MISSINNPHHPLAYGRHNRRRFIQGLGFAGTALFGIPGLFAELAVTPRLTEGPFYPDKLPLDRQ